MENYLLLILVGLGAWTLNSHHQRKRIALLGSHLQNYRIEKLMETLSEGYLRALAEDAPARRDQIWELMQANETSLSSQFTRFAAEMACLDGAELRVSSLPVAIPYADQIFPNATFDLRKALDIHARGLARAVDNHAARAPKERAYILSAEMYLMQHTCHWYCKSRAVASARLLARHKASHAQVLAAVSPETRHAYRALIGG
ncbi:MAG: hypothetical protein HYS20_10135 [Rhodocyclales bacterium]|nr:hypothetical protein [Rhodocyclales bacterium]